MRGYSVVSSAWAKSWPVERMLVKHDRAALTSVGDGEASEADSVATR